MDWTRKDFFVVQERTERRFRGALNFGVIEDGCVLVGGEGDTSWGQGDSI